MADDKKPATQQDKGDSKEKLAERNQPFVRAAPVEPEIDAAPVPAKPNLTQQQVEGFIQNQLAQKGMPSEQAAVEAKKRAAEMVKTERG